MIKSLSLVSLLIVCILLLLPVISTRAADPVNLGTADSFAVLAGAGITNTGTTSITGDVGSYPTTTQTGFGTVTITGTNHMGDTTTQTAKTDLSSAYSNAAGQTPTGTITANLGGQTLTPGVYRDNDAPDSLALTGTLILDAQGDANAIFIFQSGSTLITAPGSSVSLINGAQACNIFWQVGSSATLDTTTSFQGNILAAVSITLNTGASITGRLLAQDGAITLDTNSITRATCAVASPTPTPTPTPTPSATPTPTPDATATPTPTPTATTQSTASTTTATINAITTASPDCPAFTYVIPHIITSNRVDPDSIALTWGPFSGITSFNIRYGSTNGEWRYNTDVSGFSTIINDLPPNQPMWVQVAARNSCSIGVYGEASFVGSPNLPTAGLAPRNPNSWQDSLTVLKVWLQQKLVPGT